MLIALLSSACDDNNVNSDNNNDSTDKTTLILLPLAIGNQWITNVLWYNSDGSLVLSRMDTLLIVDTTTLGEKLYYISNKGNYILMIPMGSGYFMVRRRAIRAILSSPPPLVIRLTALLTSPMMEKIRHLRGWS